MDFLIAVLIAALIASQTICFIFIHHLSKNVDDNLKTTHARITDVHEDLVRCFRIVYNLESEVKKIAPKAGAKTLPTKRRSSC